MSAMKRHLENKIAKLQEEKRQNKAIIVDGVISSPKITYTEKVNKRSCINAVSAINENLYSYLNDIRSAIMDKNI